MTFRSAGPNVAATLWMAEHPEWWALTCSAIAWGVMLTARPDWHGSLCAAADGGFLHSLRVAWDTGVVSHHVTGWVVMAVAMTPPLAVPLIRHVAVRSFAARRHRAIAVFLIGVLTTWLLAGMAGLVFFASTSITRPDATSVTTVGLTTVGFLLAAIWQLTPMKRVALLRCHRTFPLGPAGWRADRDCFRHGFVHGIDCVTSCWALMLAAMFASHAPAVGLGVQVIAMAEQRARLPRFGLSAAVLAGCALLAELLARF